MTVLLGTLWSSIKQIEAPYGFDWENAIGLDTMQGNRPSSRREGKVSWVFASYGRKLGYILELQRGCPFETLGCGRKIQTLLEIKWESRTLFLFDTVILGFLSNIMEPMQQIEAPYGFDWENAIALGTMQGN